MKSPIHVMHLLPSLNVGGMENGVVNVTNRIDRRRFTVTICCINEIGPMRDRIAPGAATILGLSQGPGKSFRLFVSLRRLLLAHRVDVLHTHNYPTSVYGVPAARAAGVRVICGQHGFVYDPGTNRIRKQRIDAALCRLSNHVCCVSRSLADVVCGEFRVPPRNVTTILNGVDVDRFVAADTRRDAVRRGLGIAGGDVVIGSVGRLHREKNYALLVTAVAGLSKRHPVRLLLVGDGPDAAELNALVRTLACENAVIMAGERPDVPDMLAAMDVFALPSRAEGLPNTVLEAMAARLPVVASNVGGTPDLVADGESGFLFARDDQAALSGRLEQLTADPSLRARMGGRGRERASGEFSLARMVSRYEDMYERLAESR